MNKLLVSPSPHIHSKTSTRSLMLDVVIALLPSVLVTILFYGWSAVVILASSVVFCVLLEYLITKYLLKKPGTIGDMSAVVTGIILALNLPPTAPWWVAMIGAIVAIGVAKMTFGGLGQNVFNPAITGRVFLLISFPAIMTTWGGAKGFIGGADAVSGATPLGIVKEGLMQGQTIDQIFAAHDFSYLQMLFVNIGGSAGEDPLFNLLTGGVLLGSVFMATDYVTSPMSDKGGIIFGIGIGIITMLIRYFGSYPEGMSFAILIMNSTVPLINKFCKQKKFGRA